MLIPSITAELYFTRSSDRVVVWQENYCGPLDARLAARLLGRVLKREVEVRRNAAVAVNFHSQAAAEVCLWRAGVSRSFWPAVLAVLSWGHCALQVVELA